MTLIDAPSSERFAAAPPPRGPGARPVPFFVEAAAARDVRITGDFSRWSRSGVRLHHDGHGLWRALLSLPLGVYEYRLLVDGEWADHPHAVRHVPNEYGSRNSILIVA